MEAAVIFRGTRSTRPVRAWLLVRRAGWTLSGELVEQNTRTALHGADCGYVMETGTMAASATLDELLGDRWVREVYLGRAVRGIARSPTHAVLPESPQGVRPCLLR